MGIYTVQEFLFFYIKCAPTHPNVSPTTPIAHTSLLCCYRYAVIRPEGYTPEFVLAFTMVPLLFMGLLSPIIAVRHAGLYGACFARTCQPGWGVIVWLGVQGWVSDRIGGRRKMLVYAAGREGGDVADGFGISDHHALTCLARWLAGSVMIVTDLFMAFNRAWYTLPIVGAVFGIVRVHTCCLFVTDTCLLSLLTVHACDCCYCYCYCYRALVPLMLSTLHWHWYVPRHTPAVHAQADHLLRVVAMIPGCAAIC